ncbi:MAG: rhodanese-like domain-containing protein, partial [Methanothrix sp.]|nr:rhodanese-like domain-containing protein [Methanothrix sp.]
SWTASAQSFLSTDVPLVGVTASDTARSDTSNSGSFKSGAEVGLPANRTGNGTISAPAGVYVTPGSRDELFVSPEMLKSLDALFEDEVVLDVSNAWSSGRPHLRGAINMPAASFFQDDSTLRNASDLAAMLGRSGVSSSDSVMVYSDAFSSGEATAVLWALLCLGQESVRALDGGLDNWIGASLPLETASNSFPPVEYVPGQSRKYEADRDLVGSEGVQLVDARSILDYGRARIGNATFISPDDVLIEGRLKPNLNDTFARLNESRTVVVYSDDIYSASLVWFALMLTDYDAKIYLQPELEEQVQRDF